MTTTAPAGDQPPLSPEASPVVAALLARQILAEEDDPEQFRLACHHRHELTHWFSEHSGWRFHVERQAGICRLYKRRFDPPAGRVPLVHRSRPSARTPVPPLVQILTALICEQMWRAAQTTFNHLQRAVIQACGTEAPTARLPRFQPGAPAGQRQATAAAHRMAFIDALRLLESWHLLAFDQPLNVLEQGTDADLAITARRERLALLIACPPPSLLPIDLDDPNSHVTALCPDQAPPPEGAPPVDTARHHRRTALRAVLDDPGLPPDPATGPGAYLSSWSGREQALNVAAAAGLTCTVRQDWWMTTDPAGHTTDLAFPQRRTVEQQAALLLLHALTRRDDPLAWFGLHWASDALAAHLRQRPWWARNYQGAGKARTLATAAVHHLLSIGACTADPPPGTGWQPTPAAHLWQLSITNAPRSHSATPAHEEDSRDD
ncbi:DUF2398 family protein [Streptomyces sp. NPDC014733]|uniref:DUF2398 family protein n=1 Tax=Streptomyces sp. NPDC014733 TaxID=3364885 RepID=UPI0036FB7D38